MKIRQIEIAIGKLKDGTEEDKEGYGVEATVTRQGGDGYFQAMCEDKQFYAFKHEEIDSALDDAIKVLEGLRE